MYPFFAMDSLQALQPAVGAAEHSGSCSTHTNHMPVCHNSLRYWSKYLTVTMWRRSPLTYYKCPHLPIIHFCEVCTLFFLQHFYKLRNCRCDPQIRGEHFGNKARQWLTTSTYTSSPCKTFVAKQGKAEMPNTCPIGNGFSRYFCDELLLLLLLLRSYSSKFKYRLFRFPTCK